MVEFNKDNIIKTKVYFYDYVGKSENKQVIIVIIHYKCTFSTNDNIQKAKT